MATYRRVPAEAQQAYDEGGLRPAQPANVDALNPSRNPAYTLFKDHLYLAIKQAENSPLPNALWLFTAALHVATQDYVKLPLPQQPFSAYLPRYFRPFLPDKPTSKAVSGSIDMILDFTGVPRQALTPEGHKEMAQIIDEGRGNLLDALRTFGPLSLDAEVSPGNDGDSDMTLGDLQASSSAAPDEEALTIVRNEALYTAIAELPERDGRILRSRFGLDGTLKEKTLAEVGKEFGLTRERIRQLEAKALDRLRRNMTLIKETQ